MILHRAAAHSILNNIDFLYITHYIMSLLLLSLTLSKSNIGRRLSGKRINHVPYADDLCIMSMSPCGMQNLRNICEQYRSDHDIMYISKKSLTMLIQI